MNPIRGQISFASGEDRYTLVYSVNALAALEDALNTGINEIAALFQDTAKIRLGTLRTVFRCGLGDHHPALDDTAAGQIMDAIGIAAASDLIGKALTAAFAPAEPAQSNGASPRPLSQAATTGSRTMRPGSRRVAPLTPSGA